jgi:hypothetical protein
MRISLDFQSAFWATGSTAERDAKRRLGIDRRSGADLVFPSIDITEQSPSHGAFKHPPLSFACDIYTISTLRPSLCLFSLPEIILEAQRQECSEPPLDEDVIGLLHRNLTLIWRSRAGFTA